MAPNKASSCYMGTGLTLPLTLSAKVLPCATGLKRGLRIWGCLGSNLSSHLASLAQALATLGLSFPIRQMGECSDGHFVVMVTCASILWPFSTGIPKSLE